MSDQSLEVREQSDLDAAAEETRPGPVYSPAVDIFENDQDVLLVAEIPGVRSDDVDVRLENGELILSARLAADSFFGGEVEEFGAVDYLRTFKVRKGLDENNIKATLERGLLTVTLPKAKSGGARQIPVAVG